MIEVLVSVGTYEGAWKLASSAECEDPESALLCARILWDESYTQTQGCRRQVRFVVDDELVRTTEARP